MAMNENRAGYKKTKFVWIPDDWDIIKIGFVAKINETNLKENTNDDYEFYYIDLSSIKKGKIDFPKNKIYFKNSPSRARRILKENDIIMATVRPNLQGFALADFRVKNIICSTGFALISTNKLCNARYLYHFLYSNIITRQIHALLVGSNYPAINSTDVSNLKFISPPLPEQKKIAEILSTWDKAIELTEKLIQTESRRKKGLMQQLLTGKKQFGKEKWDTIEFGNFCNLSKKKYIPKKDNEIYKCIELEHLDQGTGRILGFTTTDKQASIKNKFKKNQVLFGKLRPYLKKYAYPDFDGVCSSEIWVLDVQKKVCNSRYLFYLIQSHLFIQIANVTSGTKMPRSDWKFVSQYPFELPVLQEQTKIATVLTACDQKLTLLTQKLEALKIQKKGLMQKLLTGEIRVKT